jgi:hypothetical protein
MQSIVEAIMPSPKRCIALLFMCLFGCRLLENQDVRSFKPELDE